MLVFRGNSGDPQQRVCSLGHNPQALVWKWRQNSTLNINIPNVNAPASTIKVFILKLKNYSELVGSKFLPLAPVNSVASSLGHPLPRRSVT